MGGAALPAEGAGEGRMVAGGRRGVRRRSAHAGGGLGQRPRGAGCGEEGLGQPPAVGRRIDGHDLFRLCGAMRGQGMALARTRFRV